MTKLANFKISIVVKELSINVEGDREIVPEIASNVAQQVTGVLQPAGLLEAPKDGHNSNPVVTVAVSPARRTRGRRSMSTSAGGGNGTIDWNHDPAKWGTPVQEWKNWQKIMWLLLVVAADAGKPEGLTTSEMAAIYKQKFFSTGVLTKGNIPRDLKGRTDYFGEVDDRWHLKESGKAEAAKLVAEAKGQKTSIATA
jgi:hypothetical protein